MQIIWKSQSPSLETEGTFQSVANLLRLLHHKHIEPIFLLSQEAVSAGSLVLNPNDFVSGFFFKYIVIHQPQSLFLTFYLIVVFLLCSQTPATIAYTVHAFFTLQVLQEVSLEQFKNTCLVCLSFLSSWVYVIRFRFSTFFGLTYKDVGCILHQSPSNFQSLEAKDFSHKDFHRGDDKFCQPLKEKFLWKHQSMIIEGSQGGVLSEI